MTEAPSPPPSSTQKRKKAYPFHRPGYPEDHHVHPCVSPENRLCGSQGFFIPIIAALFGAPLFFYVSKEDL